MNYSEVVESLEAEKFTKVEIISDDEKNQLYARGYNKGLNKAIKIVLKYVMNEEMRIANDKT